MKRLVVFVGMLWASLLLALLVHWQRTVPERRVERWIEEPDGVPPMDPWLERQGYDAGLAPLVNRRHRRKRVA